MHETLAWPWRNYNGNSKALKRCGISGLDVICIGRAMVSPRLISPESLAIISSASVLTCPVGVSAYHQRDSFEVGRCRERTAVH